MKCLVAILLAVICGVTPAAADVFDVTIPGVGRPEKVEADFAPGVDGTGEPQGPFSGMVSFPFLAYCRVYRANYDSASTVNQEIRIVAPSGRVVDASIGANRVVWAAGTWYQTTYRKVDRLDEFGTYTFQFIYNGVEAARLTLDVKQRY